MKACILILMAGLGALGATEPFYASWDSLKAYQCPEWFRDAKFGIWAHWSPQCQPEHGDWYARRMYVPGEPDYADHLARYGHPSQTGFKDICRLWKAENWDPNRLMALYRRAGAQYFVALANHHCNFDCFDSKFQPWNSVEIGPRKDLVGLWAKAARRQGLRFGVSIHAARAWNWYEVAQGSDTNGPLQGVPYDGKLTAAGGKGQWWEGLDPQDLYAQNHPPGAPPDAAYIDKFFFRVMDLIQSYQPDLLYFDDSVLPFNGVSDVGLRIAAQYYNASLKRHGGRNEAVMTTKRLNEEQRRCLVYDIERGLAADILPQPWQTDTCIGSWHYDRRCFDQHKYKTAAAVIPLLADIVSKNGNLLLSVPVRGDGTLDADEIAFLEDMANWMKVNREAIFGTRPWKIYGEGPSTTAAAEPGRFGGVKDTRKEPFTAQDLRFTAKGQTLYALALAWPADGKLRIRSLGQDRGLSPAKIKQVELLGAKSKLTWLRTAEELSVNLPVAAPCQHAFVLRIAPVETGCD
jgi:alpha-L-fucosidase